MASAAGLRPVRGTAREIFELLLEWDRAVDPAPLVIQTSGSTGEPKHVVLPRAAIRASVEATHRRLGGPGQWVLNMPPTFVAGVQVLFRAVRAGVEPLIGVGLSCRELSGQITGDRAYLSMVPTQLHRALGDGSELSGLTRFSAVLVGGGPARREDLTTAYAAGINVVRTYGMSETCGGCVYDGRPLDGVEVRVVDGHILLRGPMLFDGYLGEPERTAASLDGGWLRTHDLGSFEDGLLEVFGREDDVIISGGVKVPALAVADQLRRHPDIDDACVVGIPDAEWGERVVAAIVVPSTWHNPDPRTLVTPAAWVPKELLPVPRLPLLPNGKPDRASLKAMF